MRGYTQMYRTARLGDWLHATAQGTLAPAQQGCSGIGLQRCVCVDRSPLEGPG